MDDVWVRIKQKLNVSAFSDDNAVPPVDSVYCRDYYIPKEVYEYLLEETTLKTLEKVSKELRKIYLNSHFVGSFIVDIERAIRDIKRGDRHEY